MPWELENRNDAAEHGDMVVDCGLVKQNDTTAHGGRVGGRKIISLNDTAENGGMAGDCGIVNPNSTSTHKGMLCDRTTADVNDISEQRCGV